MARSARHARADRYDRYSGGGMLWAPYVPVAQRRAQAEKEAAKLARKGRLLLPVHIEGRTIARSFWGKSWNDNLTAYSDFANRLPRGATYVRNGSVIDLQIAQGKVSALVSGSSIYSVEVTVAPLGAARWKQLVDLCSGEVGSLVDLLQGKLSGGVMQVVTQPASGLFPAPREITMRCSCPDGATMCKHVAAVLYGVGARLDRQPEVLFTLRAVDPTDLLTAAVSAKVPSASAPASAARLQGEDLSSLFGVDIDEAPSPPNPASGVSSRKHPPAPDLPPRAHPASAKKSAPAKKKAPVKQTAPAKKTVFQYTVLEPEVIAANGITKATIARWLEAAIVLPAGTPGQVLSTPRTKAAIADLLAARARRAPGKGRPRA